MKIQMANSNYDIVVIGAGPGGYTAAIRAAQRGKKVAIIEKNDLGGTCLNHGCIPTKTLQASSKLLIKMKKAGLFGINADNISIDLPKVIDRKDRILGQLRKGLEYLFKGNGVDLIRGEAKVRDGNNIEVNGSLIRASKMILATGSTIIKEPPVKIDEKRIFSSDGILNLRVLPKNMAIIGAGPMGLEFAGIFNSFGSKVTVFEIMPQVMPSEDAEIAKALEQSLTKKGITIRTGTAFKDDGSHDCILVSIGRTLNTEAFASLGIKLNGKKVVVNEKMMTNMPNIYAIGDIAGRYMFAHSASAEGIVAAENASGKSAKIDYTAVPRCVFSDPSVAAVGLTEEEARKKHGSVKIGKFPFAASSKSLIEDERDGFIKIIADKNDKVLGVHIIGGSATEMIGEAVLAVNKGLKVEDIAGSIHAHPTVYESMYEAAESVLKQSIAILNKT